MPAKPNPAAAVAAAGAGAPAPPGMEDLVRMFGNSMQGIADSLREVTDTVRDIRQAPPPPAAAPVPAAVHIPPPAPAPIQPPGGDVEKDIKCPRFYNELGEDFLEWKAAALRSLEGKVLWNPPQKCRYLLSQMRRSAAVTTQHMQVAEYANVNELMAALEMLFVTEGGTAAARQAFRDAHQTQNESLQRWHTRVISLFRRALPNYPEAELDANQELRERFLFGLHNARLGKDTMRANPPTITEAMNIASRFHAIDTSYQHGRARGTINSMDNFRGRRRSSHDQSRSRSRSRDEDSVNGLRRDRRRCNICQKQGHLQRDCPDNKGSRRGPRRGRGGGNRRGGRGGGGRGGQSNRQRLGKKNFAAPLLASIQDRLQDEAHRLVEEMMTGERTPLTATTDEEALASARQESGNDASRA